MSTEVDLYNGAYENYDIYREIRDETYGKDLGQTSWVTSEESKEIPALLELTSNSAVLEIGCGSGGYALQVAEMVGCNLVGLDINPHGIANAKHLALEKNLSARTRFEHCDVSNELPFQTETFDAVFANDVLCHVSSRQALLGELCRVLKPGGRLLFSDALVIAGMVSNEEIATRSSIGRYVFSPPGENQRLIGAAGLELLTVKDTSDEAAGIARRWHDARLKRRDRLIASEGEGNFAGLQRFLSCVQALTSEKRLLRHVYLARKPA